MTVFLSSYTNTVDKKGRVSVPASFRAELATHSRQMVVVYAAPDAGFLYGWGYDDFILFANRIKKLPPMSKERQRLSRTILAAARPLGFDAEGRILVPDEFLKKAGIEGKALFAGEGDYFTLWNPARYEQELADDMNHFEEDFAKLSAEWGGDE